MNKLNLNVVNLLLVIALAIVLLVNVVTLAGVNKMVAAPAPNATEPQAAITLELTAIKPVDCPKCADATQIIEALKQSGQVTVSKSDIIDSDSSEAKALIAKYKITRLPVIILKGDIAKLPPSEQLEISGDVALLRQLPPPFYDLTTKKMAGVVDVTYLTVPLCSKCSDITLLSKQLESAGVAIGKEEQVVYDSVSGKDIIEKYNITAVPTAIFSADAKEYPIFVQAWTTAGTVDADGSFVLRQVVAPYYDLATEKLRGLTKITYLTDKSCATCYNATMHKSILASNFGIVFDKESTVDVSSDEGKALIKKYNITQVPTVLIGGDTAAYPQLKGSWTQVGTVDKDGTYVFLKVELLEGIVYKDLTTGKLVGQAAPVTPDTSPPEANLTQ